MKNWLCITGVLLLAQLAVTAADKPNVIIMVTDDAGYGDYGATGNPLFKTPHLDDMAARSGSMNTFYVSPVCSPTRASLMTGRYNQRSRCIDTWLGRSMLEGEAVTFAEVMKAGGYATGIFGKWHLGDCYPMRPMDQGFDRAVVHLGGGLAQPSEPLENKRRYTNPILFENGQAVQTTGFCTDVYFDYAMEFVEKQSKAGKPFFIYLPTNAPHGPFHDVPEKWLKYYEKRDLTSLLIKKPKNAAALAKQRDTLNRIAAMVSNFDDNVGRLMKMLAANDLHKDTIVIYMDDNGPNGQRYVGDFRGAKSWVHEGGIRSPFWVHAPGRVKAGAQSDALSAHIDVMPTIMEACNIAKPAELALDGHSFWPLLTGTTTRWPDRKLVIQTHRGDHPVKYHHFMIRQGDWKLLHASGFGKESFTGQPNFELYNLKADPGEQNNLADANPEVLKRLKASYDAWFEDVGANDPKNYLPPRIIIGTDHEPMTHLTRQDWRGGNWNPRGLGTWYLNQPEAVPYAMKVIVEPGAISDAAVALKVTAGEKLVAETTLKPGAVDYTFQNVQLPIGDFELTAILSEPGKEDAGPLHVQLTRQ